MKKIAIIGGGAAGYFCAANLKKSNKYEVSLFEQGQRVLKKVKISGGGRCNVTHNIFEVRPFASNYPRGERELISPLHQFQAKDTLSWFLKKDIKIIAESDGRMFPTTNDSQTIINCLENEAKKNQVKTYLSHKLVRIVNKGNRFQLDFKNNESLEFDRVLICTGSSEQGYQLATQLGHSITERAPSLFSFKIKHPTFKDLSGISFADCQLKLTFKDSKKSFKSSGPLLITHWGLSGPAILKLSAWAAREMKVANYKATLHVDLKVANLQGVLNDFKSNKAKSKVSNVFPNELPKRFWHNLIQYLKIDSDKLWADVNKKELSAMMDSIAKLELNINGQNRFKDEFVECGGVALKEINLKTMESKLVPGLYFAGEILDVDGVTGGFNFQNAWTTSWITAQNITL